MNGMENPKAKYVDNALAYGAESVDEPKYTRKGNVLDLSGLMDLPGQTFTVEAFRVALLRDADENELQHFKGLIRAGATNPVLAHIICASDEIPASVEKPHLDEYKKAYDKFVAKSRGGRNRVTRWLRALVTMPTRTNNREAYLVEIADILDKKLDARANEIAALRNEIAAQRSEVQALKHVMGDEIARSFSLVSGKVDESLIATLNQFQKVDAGFAELNTLVVGKANLSKTAITGLPGGVTVVQLEECMMAVPSEDWRLAMQLSINNHFEPGSEKLFMSIVKPGMNVVDVGANLGIYTLLGLGKGGNVYAFEPTPSSFKLLEENIILNGHRGKDTYKLYNNAVSDTEMDLEFSINPGDVGQSNSFYAKDGSSETIQVHAVVLDEVLKDIPAIDVVKIDVEGAEPLVLRGMKRIIRNNPQIRILMEFAADNMASAGVNPGDLLAEIEELGLCWQAIDEETGELSDVTEETLVSAGQTTNLLLSHKGAQ